MEKINETNMDLVWGIIGSKEKPTADKLAQLNNPALAKRIKLAFNSKHGDTEQSLFDEYWKLEFRRRTRKFVEAETASKRPQSVVIGDTHYTRYGEPLKRGDKVEWVSLFGYYQGVLVDFYLVASFFGIKVTCVVKSREHEKPIILNDCDKFNVDGQQHEKYFDAWLRCPCRENLP